MFYYLAAEYFSHKRNKMISVFSGPHSPTECTAIFDSSIRQYPNSNYEVYQSQFGNRDAARSAWVAERLRRGVPIDDAMGRTYRQVPQENGKESFGGY